MSHCEAPSTLSLLGVKELDDASLLFTSQSTICVRLVCPHFSLSLCPLDLFCTQLICLLSRSCARLCVLLSVSACASALNCSRTISLCACMRCSLFILCSFVCVLVASPEPAHDPVMLTAQCSFARSRTSGSLTDGLISTKSNYKFRATICQILFYYRMPSAFKTFLHPLFVF